jgi:hypothetical protein
MLKRQRNYTEPTYTTNGMSNYTERNDSEYEHKRFKAIKSSPNYINLTVNEHIFNNLSISELRSVVDEIDEIVTKLENYKERIQNITAIYS